MDKNITLQYANRIKFESVQEFDTSIFSDIYQMAYSITKEIIYVNKNNKRKTMESFFVESQECNCIAFLGERGMGKSSVMMSFAYYLKNYNDAKADSGRFYFEEADNLDFFVLPKIDASMIMESESFFDFVLAKMWDSFNDKLKNSTSEDCFLNQTKIKFSKVRKSYADYGNKAKDKLKESQLTELHELSHTLNLKNDFSDLVKSFLHYMKKKDDDDLFLIIPIDDLDMASHNLYYNLEQMRLFLMIPKVIILVTADIDRLSLGIKTELSKQLLFHGNITERDKKNLNEYANNYLAKVLPRNMRIYMPYLNGMDGARVTLDYDAYVRNIFSEKSEVDAGTVFDERKYVCIILAKFMNILMYPSEYAYSIRTKSLRNIVNSIYELDKISRKQNNYSLLYQWVKKDINLSKPLITDENHMEFLINLMNVNEEILNCYLIDWLEVREDDNLRQDKNPGYARVLNCFLKMEKEWIKDSEFFRILLWFYSVSISKLIEENDLDDLERTVVRNDILYSVLGENELEGYQRNMAQLFNMEWVLSDGEKEFISENYSNIMNLFKLLLFTDMEDVLKKVELHINIVEGDVDLENGCLGEKRAQTYADFIFTSVHVENYFRNVIRYDELWEKYFLWVHDNILNMIANGEDTVGKEYEEHITLWKKWKERYCVYTVYDIIPIQDVTVMLEIAEWMKFRVVEEDAEAYLTDIIDLITDVLKEAEVYCEVEKIGDIRLKYSEKLTELHKIVNLEDVDIEKRRILISRGNLMKDPSL